MNYTVIYTIKGKPDTEIACIKAGRCPWCNSFLNVYYDLTKCSDYRRKQCPFKMKTSEYNEVRNG